MTRSRAITPNRLNAIESLISDFLLVIEVGSNVQVVFVQCNRRKQYVGVSCVNLNRSLVPDIAWVNKSIEV